MSAIALRWKLIFESPISTLKIFQKLNFNVANKQFVKRVFILTQSLKSLQNINHQKVDVWLIYISTYSSVETYNVLKNIWQKNWTTWSSQFKVFIYWATTCKFFGAEIRLKYGTSDFNANDDKTNCGVKLENIAPNDFDFERRVFFHNDEFCTDIYNLL